MLVALEHECAHSLAAAKLGFCLNRVVLMPYGAVITGNLDGISFKDEIRVAAAGPLCNLCTALFFAALWWLFPDTYAYTDTAFYLSLFIGAGNLLPFYPLDGGRVFVSLLSAKTDYAKALKVSKILSVALSGALFFVFLCMCFAGVPNFSLGLFAVFVLSAGLSETKGEIFSKQIVFEVYKKRLDRGVEKKTLVFSEEATLKSVAKRMSHHFVYRIEVVEAKDGEVKKVFSHAQFLNLLSSHALDTPLKELL